MLAGRGAVDTYVDARSVGTTREAAFLGAVEGNLDRLFSTAYRLTRDRAEAEELVRETLLRAWAGMDPGRDAREVLAYVYRILVNLARDRGRRRAVVHLRPTDPRTLPEEEVPASRSCSWTSTGSDRDSRVSAVSA